MKRALRVRLGRLAICRFPADAPPPAWLFHAEATFLSITRTPDEMSVVCAEEDLPPSITAFEGGWRAIHLEGPIPFTETGVLASMVAPLAAGQVPVFALSTYNTDWVLVKESDLARAMAALRSDFVVSES